MFLIGLLVVLGMSALGLIYKHKLNQGLADLYMDF